MDGATSCSWVFVIECANLIVTDVPNDVAVSDNHAHVSSAKKIFDMLLNAPNLDREATSQTLHGLKR